MGWVYGLEKGGGKVRLIKATGMKNPAVRIWLWCEGVRELV